jgi:cytoskeletal protein CcmA (bactofilin family)
VNKPIGINMFSKSKKPEIKNMVVAPVPIPPKDIEGEKSVKENPSSPVENKVFTKVAPSVLSSDLKVKGNLLTSGDIQIEGIIEGDIQAHLLTVGETSKIKGEIIADDVIINGNVIGCVRGLKVRLTNKARVQGDIIHKAIAIESGAHFEGTGQRTDNPFENAPEKKKDPIEKMLKIILRT